MLFNLLTNHSLHNFGYYFVLTFINDFSFPSVFKPP